MLVVKFKQQKRGGGEGTFPLNLSLARFLRHAETTIPINVNPVNMNLIIINYIISLKHIQHGHKSFH